MYLGQEIKQILPGNVAVGGANMGMVPLFAVMWCPSRSSIWAGYVAADGQELSKALYPDADAGIQAGNVPAAIEATWQSTPTERGKYVATSSAGKFRLPDLNGVSVGTLGAVFLRGDGVNSSGTDGVIQLDEYKSHAHTLLKWAANGHDTTGGPYLVGADTAGYQDTSQNTTASGGAETRPLNVTGCWVIKLFGSVTNAGSADAAQLATDYAALAANKVDIASFLGSNQSLAASGYQKLPGGLIIQWGDIQASYTPVVTVNAVVFPIAFPNGVRSVVVARGQGLQSPGGVSEISEFVTASGFSVLTVQSGGTNNYRVFWHAIGY